MSELQQFCILAQSQKGRACAALIEQALSNRRLYYYEELLSIPSVQALHLSDYEKVFRTLQLFAHGSYQEFLDCRNEVLELSLHQMFKLKQLSLLRFFQQKKIVSYSNIVEKLQLNNRKEVEELVMESISSGLLFAKIDQLNSIIHVFLIQNPPSQNHADNLNLSAKLEAWYGFITGLNTSSSRPGRQSRCASILLALSDTVKQSQDFINSADFEKLQVASICERNRKFLKEEIDSMYEGSHEIPRRK